MNEEIVKFPVSPPQLQNLKVDVMVLRCLEKQRGLAFQFSARADAYFRSFGIHQFNYLAT
jgi:hypothetical protein